MAGQRNYQKELDRLTESLEREGKKPRLFLHSCCAPCSSYVLEYLSRYFSVTVFYYNPNISPEEEYRKRVEEQKRLIRAFSSEIDGAQIDFREGIYDPETFRRAENAASGVMSFGFGRLRVWQKRETMIIFVRHFPSVL